MNRRYRKTVIAGNWKMNMTATETKECVEGTAEPELTHDPNKINYSVKLNPGRSESRSESGTPKSAS